MKHLLCLILSVALLATTVSSRPGGIDSSGNNGCVCHGGADDSTTVSLEGIPTIYDPGVTYFIYINITSPVIQNDELAQGGFRLTSDSAYSDFEIEGAQFIDGGLTHNYSINGQRSWSGNWTAPEQSDLGVRITLAGNAVDGDNSTDGDEWNLETYAIRGPDYIGDLEPEDIELGLSTVEMVVGGLIFMAVGYFAIISMRD
ncbi:MAG TPA: hypothetical protein EYQ73_04165 [Candidatus Poseidoniales archaeon]|jgi:hypothetical protein|nr:MAG: hypothetical protein CXT71_04085 [Euryarchaeota archaeon]HIF45976.1 hypothetical protein [Candidatus Poseidoniales archaeon]HIL65427.1 hypothetical protein [Candidatus Poseidoniales archaeon]